MVVGGTRRIFVTHRVAGVHVIPEDWLDAWRPSGFREATPLEVARWYDERGFEPPAHVLARLAGLDGDQAEAASPVAPEAPPPPTITA